MWSDSHLTVLSPNLREKSGGLKSLNEKIDAVRDRIRSACLKSKRNESDVTLIAVSKTKSAELVKKAAELGVLNFGENYVQEALKKIEKIDQKLSWHFIGHLQTNKSKPVVGKFETIQSVDRIELAKALSARAVEAGLVQKILMQIKLGDEPNKGGVAPSKAVELMDKIQTLPNIFIGGLMTLPPIEADPEENRKYFSELRGIATRLAPRLSSEKGKMEHLSMGTTYDFEVAIEEGATMIRVGTAIFGPRELVAT